MGLIYKLRAVVADWHSIVLSMEFGDAHSMLYTHMCNSPMIKIFCSVR